MVRGAACYTRRPGPVRFPGVGGGAEAALFRFGEFELDPAARELRREGRALTLPIRGFDLLETLVANRPRALTHAELHDRLWPTREVGHAALPRLVNVIRGVLGESARSQRWLRTVHGYGYAFDAPAGTTAGRAGEGAPCWLRWGRRRIGLHEGDNVVGRGAGAAVAIPSNQVSRRHARIAVRGGVAQLIDLGSLNGTWHRGRRVEGSVELRDGDDIAIGPALLLFHAATASRRPGARRRRHPGRSA